MGAFNWILVHKKCPSCQREATIRCQTHVASSLAGPAEERFANREYRLGEKMRWWGEEHSEYQSWRVLGRKDAQLESRFAEEACYSECLLCGAELYVVLRFENVTPMCVLGLGPKEEWPHEYWK